MFINFQKRATPFLIMIVLLVSPFGTGNNSVVGISCFLFLIFFLLTLKFQMMSLSKYERNLFSLYSIYLAWCFVASIKSTFMLASFEMLGFYSLYLLTFVYIINFNFYKNNIIKLYQICLFISSVFLLCFTIGGLCFDWLNMHAPVLKILNDLYGYHGKIFKSTLNLYFILTAFVLFKNIRHRNLIIGLNLLSGFLSINRFFIIVVCILIALHYVLKYKKLKLVSIILSIFLLFIILFFMIFHFLQIDLHVTNRFAVYEYWLPRLGDYWLWGTGLGLKTQAYVAISHFPIPVIISQVEPNVYVHSHNLFLDKAIQSGVIGGFLYIIVLIALIRVVWNSKSNHVVLLMIILSFVLKNLVDDQTGGIQELFFWFFIGFNYALSRSFNDSK